MDSDDLIPDVPETDEAGTQDAAAHAARLESELHELRSRHLRTLADYQNYQRRALANEQEARVHTRASVVQSILSVLDHFDLALAQDLSKVNAAQIISGVRLIRDELMQVLQAQGVSQINPVPGEAFMPGRHEAITQQPAEGVPPGAVASTFQVGYTLGERVIRPAKVAVAPS